MLTQVHAGWSNIIDSKSERERFMGCSVLLQGLDREKRKET